MGKRLMTLKQIRDEKFPRSRSWIFTKIAEGRFPKPVVAGGTAPNMWDEAEVDQFVVDFVAKAKEAAAAAVEQGAERRSAKATAGRVRRRDAGVVA